MDSTFYMNTRGWQGEDLPEDFVKFSFCYLFTESDMNTLRTGYAHTSFGYRWHYYSEEKIFISRGGKCFYLLQLNPKGHKHTAILFLQDGMMGEANFGLGFSPKVLLLKILNRWFRRNYEDM